jgi:hypothetical protein
MVKIGASGSRVGSCADAMLGRGDAAFGDYTAEALRSRSKEFWIKNYSDLCELCASVVNTPSQETQKRLEI